MNPLSFLRRLRARARFNEALARVRHVERQIAENKKRHRAWRPLIGLLAEAKTDMLRAEIDMGRR